MVQQKLFLRSKRFWAIVVAIVAGVWPLIAPFLGLPALTAGDQDIVRGVVAAIAAVIALLLQFVDAKSELTLDPDRDNAA